MSHRAAIYTRISHDPEDVEAERGKGVRRQRDEILALAERHNLTVIEEYRDNDVSASVFGTKPREDYERMVESVKAGRVDTVSAWDLDRLIRRPREGEDWIEMNAASGVNLLTVSEAVDLSTPNGKLFLRLKVSVASHESEHKSDRIKAAHRQRLRDGRPISGRTPFGWKKGGLELEPAEADAIKAGIQHVLDGGTLTALQKKWNAAGVYGPSGKPWAVSSVKAVLRRWRNAGVLEHNGEPLDGPSAIAPIVTRDELVALRDRLQLRPPTKGRPVTKSWLAGVMKCEVCGNKMLPRKEYYQCSVSTERTRQAGDTARHCSVTKDIAERQVMLALYADANDQARWNPSEAEGFAQVRKIEHEVDAALRERAEVTAELFTPGVDKALMRRMLAELSERIEALEAQRAKVRTVTSETVRIAQLMQGPQDTGLEFTASWIPWFEALPVEEKRELARTLDITVRKGGKGARRVDIDGHPFVDLAKMPSYEPTGQPTLRTLKGQDIIDRMMQD